MSFKKEHRQETFIYLGLWGMLLLAPVISLSVRIANTSYSFDWAEILAVWKEFLPFFVVFLIHNHLLATQLIYRQRKALYFAGAVVLTVIFHIYQQNHRPDFREMRRHRIEMRREAFSQHRPDDPARFDDREPAPGPRHGDDMPPEHRQGHKPDRFDGAPAPGADQRRPPLVMGQHDLISIVILILMMGMNIGIKVYFRQRDDREKMAHLEKENLEQQLEYLKYQINPHFFMNTLNNIHALVDIDPEKAKTTILELSKMMRFVLYEGNKKGVPLDREVAFLQNYITLMKLRYTDKVRISVSLPPSLPNKEIPPLMFITFVENAFKHGVSYRQASFIEVAIDLQQAERDTLVFTCRNSRIPKEDDKHGGVGLANVKKRLQLIYGDSYSLDISDETDTYTVRLTLPL